MSAAHTPGPWALTPRVADKVDVYSQVPGLSDIPGGSTKYFARVTIRDSWQDEQEANARLIAAAPELLEALIAMRARLAIHSKHTEDLIADMQAAKAIARATGSAS